MRHPENNPEYLELSIYAGATGAHFCCLGLTTTVSKIGCLYNKYGSELTVSCVL